MWLPLAFAGCARLELPERRNGLPGIAADWEDSGGDAAGDTSDSALPAMCEWQEIEPNALSEPQSLPLEIQACGWFDEPADQDWFRAEMAEPGWIWLQLEAKARSSSANVALAVSQPASGVSTVVLDGALTNDAQLLFPAASSGELLAGVLQESSGSGSDYFWYLLITQAKPPVTWDTLETEPNGDLAASQSIEVGQSVFGTVGESRGGVVDDDWYGVTLDAEVTRVTVQATALEAGSALDAVLYVWSADGVLLHEDHYGVEGSYNPDPELEVPLDAAGGSRRWYVQVTSEHDEPGSAFHWYVLSVDVE